jgi:glycosyltransferase involved in cell wall biosynthesis
MKILHLNYYESQGGAAIAVQRIHNALLAKNIDSQIIVSKKNSNNPKVIGPNSTFEEILNLLKISFQRKLNKFSSLKTDFSQSYNLIPSNILDKIKKNNPDILHLHWIGNEMISIKQLSKIKIPIVWTLHDMWPYCASEHYTHSDDYIYGYNKKNYYFIDFNYLAWKLKKKFLNNNINFVATSNWQKNNLSKSFLYKNNYNQLIPLPIDTNFWRPIDKKVSRNILEIKTEKVILFGGDDFVSRKWKGFESIKTILKEANKNKLLSDTTFIFFGDDKNFLNEAKNFEINFKYFKNIAPNSYDLKLLYSASDLLLVPSSLESFGQLALEAMSCGIPTVCFDKTGVVDIIDHLKTGYISKENSISDFINGINWCLDKKNSDFLFKNCINRTNEKFSSDKVAEMYIELYKKLI